jgi:hypothetical protein
MLSWNGPLANLLKERV